jgi:Ser/Thr protein kinase RdoA (MazF antagonist)
MDEEVLTGGFVNTVTRSGNVVFRSGGLWTESVQHVLRHLEAKGCSFAPKALGIDKRGRDMISFLPGESMWRPWKSHQRGGDALIQIANILKQVHDATRDLVFPDATVWRTGPAGKSPEQIIRHGDLGPWNTLWDGNTLTGLIDWDFAEPGRAITDLAQLALYFVPLRGDKGWLDAGFSEAPDYVHRLNVICGAYGAFTPDDVIRELDCLQHLEMARTAEWGEQGRHPWDKWLAQGDVEEFRAENEWLHATFRSMDKRVPG